MTLFLYHPGWLLTPTGPFADHGTFQISTENAFVNENVKVFDNSVILECTCAEGTVPFRLPTLNRADSERWAALFRENQGKSLQAIGRMEVPQNWQ